MVLRLDQQQSAGGEDRAARRTRTHVADRPPGTAAGGWVALGIARRTETRSLAEILDELRKGQPVTPSVIVYVDTSALGALLIEQPESNALVEWLDQTADVLVSSDLLETELRRIAVREGIDQGAVTRILDGVGLAALDRAVYRGAGLLPMPYLRTLDALHLEAAMRLDAAAVLTYDHRLGKAARAVGLQVIAPGTAHV